MVTEQTAMTKAEAPADEGPVFVLGSPRSGTSILARCLAAHRRLWTSGESYFLFELYGCGRVDRAYERSSTLSRGSWLDDQKVTLAELLAHLGAGVNALFDSRSGGRRWIDHTPHYALMADTLAEMFPAARFLHILRDGRRVVHSMVHFSERAKLTAPAGTEPFIPEWAMDFTIACRTWSAYVTAAVDFCKRKPSRGLTVVNEQLMNRTEESFRDIFGFLDLAFERGPVNCFRSHRINSSFEDSHDPEVVRKMTSPWLSWTDEQREIFDREAGACFREYIAPDLEPPAASQPRAATGAEAVAPES